MTPWLIWIGASLAMWLAFGLAVCFLLGRYHAKHGRGMPEGSIIAMIMLVSPIAFALMLAGAAYRLGEGMAQHAGKLPAALYDAGRKSGGPGA